MFLIISHYGISFELNSTLISASNSLSVFSKASGTSMAVMITIFLKHSILVILLYLVNLLDIVKKLLLLSNIKRGISMNEKRKILGSSILTRNYQVTIPSRVRSLFKFKEGDLILFIVEEGKLIIEKG